MEEFETDERKQTREKIINLRYDPICVYLKYVKEGADTPTKIYEAVRNIQPFTKDNDLLIKTKNIIFRGGLLEMDEGKLKLTEQGREKLISMENELESLYGDD